MYDLKERVKSRLEEKPNNDIVVEFDAQDFTSGQFNYLVQMSEILSNDKELEVGDFNLGIFKITINKIKTYEEELIKCER